MGRGGKKKNRRGAKNPKSIIVIIVAIMKDDYRMHFPPDGLFGAGGGAVVLRKSFFARVRRDWTGGGDGGWPGTHAHRGTRHGGGRIRRVGQKDGLRRFMPALCGLGLLAPCGGL